MGRGIDRLFAELERLSFSPQHTGLARFTDLPRIIVHHLELEAAGLKLFHFLSRSRRSISYPAESGLESRLPGHAVRQALTTGSCQALGPYLLCPLVVYGQSVGCLWLAGALDERDRAGVARLAQQVGILLEGAERKFVRHARSLTIMSRRLHATDSLEALAAVLGRGLLRYNGTLAVALRPLYGGTILGSLHVRVVPGMRRWQELFLALEGDFSAEPLSGFAAPVLRTVPDPDAFPAGSHPNLLLLPLRIKSRLTGVLTLIGGRLDLDSAGELELLEREFMQSLGEEVAQCVEQLLQRERYGQLLADRERKLRENATLYRINRLIHSTLRLDKLTHLVLSSATIPEGGGFERALLFMLNERSKVLQGMLGVGREAARRVLPEDEGGRGWETPDLSEEVLGLQKESQINRTVVKQRLALDEDSSPARAVRSGEVLLVSAAGSNPAEARLTAELGLAAYACVPLVGKNRRIGVLLVDNPLSGRPVAVDQVRFLELFASLATAAIENSMLLGRLEKAHLELLDTQEKLLQGERLAALGEMSASVAHELKNPLVAIGGFARRLTRLEDTGERQKEYAAIIARETSRMEEMLEQILAFSKKQILCLDQCRLEEVVEEAVEAAAETLEVSGVRLIRETEASLPPLVADQRKLRQVLVNLLVNACQATGPGCPIWLRTRRAELRGDEAVAIEVEDAGGGIPPELLRNVFNPFFTTKQEGTGLGLTICQRIVDHHHGEIEVYNTPAGARFTVYLPFRQNPAGMIDTGEKVG